MGAMTLIKMTLSLLTLSITIKEARWSFSLITVIVNMLNTIILSVFVLIIIMMSEVMLIVVIMSLSFFCVSLPRLL